MGLGEVGGTGERRDASSILNEREISERRRPRRGRTEKKREYFLIQQLKINISIEV